MTNPLEAYLKDMRDIRGTGAALAETSYYPSGIPGIPGRDSGDAINTVRPLICRGHDITGERQRLR